MGCSNAMLMRYKVRIQEESAPGGILQIGGISGFNVASVTSVEGLSLGEDGEVSILEYDKRVRISDGIRAIPDLSMQIRIDGGVSGELLMTFFEDWYNERQKVTRTILIDLCNRAWNPVRTYEYVGCQLRNYDNGSAELGQSKLYLVNLKFTPYNVLLKKGIFNTIQSRLALATI